MMIFVTSYSIVLEDPKCQAGSHERGWATMRMRSSAGWSLVWPSDWNVVDW